MYVASILMFAALVLTAVGESQEKEKAAARPVDAEIIVILNVAQSNCFSGAVNERLDCMITFLKQVRERGLGAYKVTPSEEDLNIDENGEPIKSRRSDQ